MRRLASSWGVTFKKLGLRRSKRWSPKKPAAFHRRSAIECLEPRQMLSITVNTLDDETARTSFLARRIHFARQSRTQQLRLALRQLNSTPAY
jgi:hypothetical protein